MKIIYKISTLFIVLVITLTLLPVITSANGDDDSSPRDFDDVMELELIQQIQSPDTKEFEYTLRLKSILNTNRVRVNWDIVNDFAIPSSGVELRDSVEVRPDRNTYITKRFKPLSAGIEELRIEVTVFGPENDYFSFIDEEFLIREESLEIAPERDEYKNSKTLLNASNILENISYGVIAFFTLANIAWLFKKWISKD